MTRGRSISLLVSVLAVIAAFIGCTSTTPSVEKQEEISISREFEFTAMDSVRMTVQDSVAAEELSATFNAVKERITLVGCTAPILSVVAFSGDATTVIDTFYLYTGARSGVAGDTLTGPTFLTSAQLIAGAPQVLWVNNPTLVMTQHLLGHAPYGFSLRAYVHATRPITRMRIRVAFPLDVNYLN